MKFKIRRAFGSQIAILYFVLIMIIGLSTYITIASNNREYQITRYSIQQIEFERSLENFTIIGEPFNETNQLNIKVLNVGSIDTELSWLKVYDPETKEPILEYTKLDSIKLRPFQSIKIDTFGQIFPGSYNKTSSYQIQLVTKRGTILEYKHPHPIPLPKKIMTQFIGPFFFDINENSFRRTSELCEEPISAYEMRDDESEVMFWLQVTNYSEESIELNGLSYIELIIHEVEGACDPYNSGCFESEVYYYISDPSSENDDLVPYDKLNPIIIMPGETTILKFASRQAFSDIFNPPNILQGYPPHDNDEGTENLLWSYIALFWKYSDSSRVYGKTIPFAAIHLVPY